MPRRKTDDPSPLHLPLSPPSFPSPLSLRPPLFLLFSLSLQSDWIGLRKLDEGGKLRMLECPGGHMRISLQWFVDEIVLPYLAPPPPPALAS